MVPIIVYLDLLLKSPMPLEKVAWGFLIFEAICNTGYQ